MQKNKGKNKPMPEFRRENMELFLTTNGKATNKTIELFADKQLDYFLNHPDELQITAYRVSKGVIRETYYKWKKKSPYLCDSHKYLLELLAYRREKVMNKHNPNLLAFKQYQYDEDWADAEDRSDDRKRKSAKVDHPTHILFGDIKEFEKQIKNGENKGLDE